MLVRAASQNATRIAGSSEFGASWNSGSASTASSPVTVRNACHSRSLVCENCIHRPSADSPTRSRKNNAWFGISRSLSTGGAALSAPGYCDVSRRTIQFHVSWASAPCTRVVSTLWPTPLASRS